MIARFTSRKEWESHRQKLIADWFPTHTAQLTKGTLGAITAEHLVWTKPGTRINSIEYLCNGPQLVVTGDLGDAIYETGADSLAWWSRCDAWYFASKCVASELGRGYREWDPDAACLQLRDRFDFEDPEDAEAWSRLVLLDGEDALYSEQAWSDWLRDNAEEVWGANWHDVEPWKIGSVIALRCEAHLAGLKLAVAQVASAERAA